MTRHRFNARLQLLVCMVMLCMSLQSMSLFVQSQQAPVGTSCALPRVRKSWDAYTSTEKSTYTSAVGLAMAKGYHQKFVEMHVEFFSELEAHRNCMFIYWHRLYLLGYENMLRSLDSKYSCVTLPVWDHLAATARESAGVCSSMEGCAPIISDFGGSTVGYKSPTKTAFVVYNVTIPFTLDPPLKPLPFPRTCVTKGVAYNFCGNSSTCPHCIMRGAPTKVRYPPSAAFASVYNQVFDYNTWASFADAIEKGVHNIVHSMIDGVMTYLQSPIDPLFYAHHSFTDALQTIYVKCQLGNESALLSCDDKGSDPRFWATCSRRNGGVYNNTDEVYMAVRNLTGVWVNVRKDPNNTLYPFFQDLPLKYADLVDAKDLGVYSYTYNLSGGLQNMYTNCNASNSISAALLLADDDGDADAEASQVAGSINSSPAETRARRWTIALYESARLNGYTDDAAREQMEMIMCMHRHECLGDVQDYSPTFRTNFGAEGHPRCFTLVQALSKGKKIIGVPMWREITSRFVPCPKKSKTTTKATATQ